MRLCVALAVSLAALVAAHGGTSNYTVGDTWYRGYDPDMPADVQDGQPWLIQRKWITIDPIFEADNISLPCNIPGDPAPASIPINAGENITAIYWYWLHPYGPMFIWLADCQGPCRDADATQLNWFKIWEAGLIQGPLPGLWYQQAFQNWNGSPDLMGAQIPTSLRPGEYLVRHEIISLHVANKPQFYPECAHLNVSGNGTAVPTEEYYAKIPGVWSMDDPSININIYDSTIQNYTMPGPPVWYGEDAERPIPFK